MIGTIRNLKYETFWTLAIDTFAAVSPEPISGFKLFDINYL